MKYIIDLYVPKEKFWMKKYNFKRIDKGRPYYTVKVEKNEKNEIVRKIRFRHLRYRCYEECWGRSNDYRKKFLRENQGPYRCRYCNRPLKEDYMVIDHVIPVAKVKRNSGHARMLLQIQGISDVNDMRNLAPSCIKCNERKRDNMGLWLVKARLGKYKWYWRIRPVLFFLFYGGICYFFYKVGVFELIWKFAKAIIASQSAV